MKNWISAGVLAILAIATQAQTTCVDPLACNFTELGECEFLDENGMPCVTEGCAIPGACNFDPEADINDGSCEFTSCLGCTDEAACNYDPEAVYLDLSCIYFVDCNGVCGGDWIEDECGNCYASQQVSDTVIFFSTGNIQELTIPAGIGFIELEVAGAQGGQNPFCERGGRGAKIKSTFEVAEGSILQMMIGESGQYNCVYGNSSNGGSGGGGGSFVWLSEGSELLLAAGGGGGGGICAGSGSTSNDQGGDASLTSAVSGYSGIFESDGIGWPEVLNPRVTAGTCQSGYVFGGGFGGGGHIGTHNGGGGGGYIGGHGGSVWAGGFGGSSYISPEGHNQNSELNLSSEGYVRIVLFGTAAPNCELGCLTTAACNFNPEATNDDGSCDFCFCGPGTEYDIELGQCMIVNGSPDINGDGCTNLGDLLDLLSGYGTCED